MINRFFIMSLMLISFIGLYGCDSEQPILMKASKQFESDEIRDQHIAFMRKNHMDALKHKRDETMYKGIRTEKHSLNACIDCHVPEDHNGQVLRHTDQEHFCTTCHTYVAAKLDCFECHVDHPVKGDTAQTSVKSSTSTLNRTKNKADKNLFKSLDSMAKDELISLAFKYSNNKNIQQYKEKAPKGGGVSFKSNKLSNNKGTDEEAINE